MVQKNHTLLRIYQNLHIHAVRAKILLSICGLRHDSRPPLKGVVCVPAVRPLHMATEYMYMYGSYYLPQWILQADLLRLSFIISCICA